MHTDLPLLLYTGLPLLLAARAGLPLILERIGGCNGHESALARCTT